MSRSEVNNTSNPWNGENRSSQFSFMRRFSEDGEISRKEFARGVWRPQIEMFQRGNDLVIRADLPGMKRKT